MKGMPRPATVKVSAGRRSPVEIAQYTGKKKIRATRMATTEAMASPSELRRRPIAAAAATFGAAPTSIVLLIGPPQSSEEQGDDDHDDDQQQIGHGRGIAEIVELEAAGEGEQRIGLCCRTRPALGQ